MINKMFKNITLNAISFLSGHSKRIVTWITANQPLVCDQKLKILVQSKSFVGFDRFAMTP